MSKIFEALQYAQMERMRLEKVAQQLPGQPEETMETLRPGLVSQFLADGADRASCKCDQFSDRIRRQGISDFLLRLFGLYPWQCSQCGRRLHRFRRCCARHSHA